MANSPISYSNYQNSVNIKQNNIIGNYNVKCYNKNFSRTLKQESISFKSKTKILESKRNNTTILNVAQKISKGILIGVSLLSGIVLYGLLKLLSAPFTLIQKKSSATQKSDAQQDDTGIVKDYVFDIPDKASITYADGKTIDLKQILKNGFEVTSYNKSSETDKYVFLNSNSSLETIKKYSPGATQGQYGVHLGPEYGGGMCKGVVLITTKKWAFPEYDSRKSLYAEPISYKNGNSKIIYGKDIPYDTEIELVSLPAKCVEIPANATINLGEEITNIKEDSVLVYNPHANKKLECLPINNFLKLYSPTLAEESKPKMIDLFNRTPKQEQVIVGDKIKTENGIEFIKKDSPDKVYYYKGNVVLSSLYYEPGYSYTASMENDELEMLWSKYEDIINQNPELKEYNCSIILKSLQNQYRIRFYSSPEYPWESSKIIKEEDFKI